MNISLPVPSLLAHSIFGFFLSQSVQNIFLQEQTTLNIDYYLIIKPNQINEILFMESMFHKMNGFVHVYGENKQNLAV